MSQIMLSGFHWDFQNIYRDIEHKHDEKIDPTFSHIGTGDETNI